MKYLNRMIGPKITAVVERNKSVLLLGARQTGKTTLIKQLNISDISYTLLDPELRLRLEKSPNLLSQEIAAYKRLNKSDRLPIVTIDEVQKVPALMDVIQLLIDNREAVFILTGSSVRKLRRHAQFNLLPGRVVNFHLDPLCLLEMPRTFSEIHSLIYYGSLPGVYLEPDFSIKQIDLEAYVKNYLEEEVRAEALVRELGSFARFLELAAIESGNQVNMSRLSQELGIGRHTLTEYFSVLEDCLIAEKIEPITHVTTRRKLTKSPKYLFFDMGIRRITALEGTQLSQKNQGMLFEQFVGLELLRMLRILVPTAKLRYWRDHAGPEVDYVIEYNKKYFPIEVKWTATPGQQDIKHLQKFMNEYDADNAYVICQCENPLLLDKNILAISWKNLESIVHSL